MRTDDPRILRWLVVFTGLVGGCVDETDGGAGDDMAGGSAGGPSTGPASMDEGPASMDEGPASMDEGSTGELPPLEVCELYLDCLSVAAPSELPAAQAGFGPDGTCWQGSPETAEQCLEACRAGLDQLQQVFPDEPMCGGTPGETVYVIEIQPIFTANCTAGCHEPGGIYAALDLTSEASYAALTTGTPVYSTDAFVEPGAPGLSLLVQALRNTSLTLRRMPLLLDDSVMPPVGVNGTPLAEADIAKVEAWILAGANP